jgi:hypothetical protein
MQHVKGISRHHMHIPSLEDAIPPNNQIRFVDVFVVHTALFKLGDILETKKNRRFNIARLFEIVRARYTFLKLLLFWLTALQTLRLVL